MNLKFIAEAGVNHNGKLSIAKKLVRAAALAGADYIKFQAFNADSLVKKGTQKAKYQMQNTKKNEDQYKMLKKLQLNIKDFKILNKECKKNKINFLLSIFDVESIKIIKELNLKVIKIPSGEITNYFLLSKLAKYKFKVILSTGMSTLKEIKEAIKVLTSNVIKKKDITILQCTTDYPSNFTDINLRAMNTLRKNFKTSVGLSDHTLGKLNPLMAAMMGANLIEKHFTLNKNDRGPDHKASLDPKELTELIKDLKNIPIILGSSEKKPTKNETIIKTLVRKSIVAKKQIRKGEKFSLDNLTAKRPGTGISPMKFKFYINKKSKKNFKKDELIK